MPETSDITMIEALGEALETMAFMVPMPPEEELSAPSESVLVRMRFKGPVNGTTELVAGQELLEMLAANVLGVEPDDEEACEKGTDAFKELLNTTCGVLLPMLTTTPEDVFDITVPESETLGNVESWEAYVAKSDVTVLDVDGFAMAVRIEFEE